MSTHHEAFYRLWHLLRQIPRYPQKVTTSEIEHGLAALGVAVSGRTLQRDLQDLSRLFPIVADERSKPYGWSWAREAKCFDLPGLSLEEALAWVLVEQHLRPLLPASAMDHLQRYFQAARERLDAEPAPGRRRNWLHKIRSVQPTQTLIPPEIPATIQRTVSEALLQERQLEVHYRKKGQQQASLYRVHPLALVLRGSVLYLQARLFDYPDTRILALHRIEQARILEPSAIAPEGFDLDEQAKRGVWDFGSGAHLRLRLQFRAGKGEHLLETPLSPDQKVDPTPGGGPGCLAVTATVADTPQLRWWLLGFGAGVEVLEPASLRDELAQETRRMAEQYAASANLEPDVAAPSLHGA
ncbi:Predicted DNA-binding transcriptional regulator YafY, contains an HTH and WYL domains [Gulbenkiania indica]|uniref:Predicted DNA-binding transcriptional regulator YafY, contains an HTH and WYL domains n=1 Tax=Gulbenkiania indica TaxID=375574 RepID=A0A0K6H826_9NEIS|nr:WYL domain-containing protein [Gulbenkiania indica]CUA86913.1 Predicted DNA-binding transcriptional regulator YafY, contains an HTH and WYL domains [Gulbenkiania indica]